MSQFLFPQKQINSYKKDLIRLHFVIMHFDQLLQELYNIMGEQFSKN